jgi:hypothetical protein
LARAPARFLAPAFLPAGLRVDPFAFLVRPNGRPAEPVPPFPPLFVGLILGAMSCACGLAMVSLPFEA